MGLAHSQKQPPVHRKVSRRPDSINSYSCYRGSSGKEVRFVARRPQTIAQDEEIRVSKSASLPMDRAYEGKENRRQAVESEIGDGASSVVKPKSPLGIRLSAIQKAQ